MGGWRFAHCVAGKMSDKKPTTSDSNTASAEPSVLDHVLIQSDAPKTHGLQTSSVASWLDQTGVLADGQQAKLASSCFVTPCAEDQVLVWLDEQGVCFVLSVLTRKAQDAPVVIQSENPMSIEAPVVGLQAESVRVHADDFLSRAKRRYAVEHTRTETVDLRVARIETDIRHADRVSDEVTGSLLQRAGTWISNTVREVRHKARTFLFD